MMIQPIVENAIRHGLAPKKHDAELEINFRLDDDYIICKIEDNGIGLKKDAIKESSNEGSAIEIIKKGLKLLIHFTIKKEN